MSEWRSGFGTAALAVLEAFFSEHNINSDDARKEFATSALKGFIFLYEHAYEKKGIVSYVVLTCYHY